jgi:hypothetical protein
MTTNKDRAEFEAAMAGHWFGGFFGRKPSGEYVDSNAKAAWIAWQARSRSGAVPAATLVGEPGDFAPPRIIVDGKDCTEQMRKALLAAPEPPQGEPIAWMYTNTRGERSVVIGPRTKMPDGFRSQPLYLSADTPRSGDALVASVEWRDVPGFEGLYQVSSAGDLKTVHTGIVKLAPPRGGGYVKAVLWKDGRRTQTGMHRLVALAFLDGQLEEVNHKNGDRSDNRVDNLEWSTRSHNVSHAHYVLGSNVKPVIARHIESGVERWFPSIEEAGRNGFSPACVYRCAHGLRNKHKGYTWRFDPLVEHSIQQPRATTGDRSDG